MYSISFHVGDHTLTKEARNAKDVKRLVYVYSSGNTEQKNAQITEILSEKEAEAITKVFKKSKKTVEDGNM